MLKKKFKMGTVPKLKYGLPGWGFAVNGEDPPIQLPDYTRQCKQESN